MGLNLTHLESLNPCIEGLRFAKRFPTLAAAWEACERSKWLLWYLRRSGKLDKPTAVTLAIGFAEPALALFEGLYPDTTAPRKALEAAKAWLANPTEENRVACRAAADAAASSGVISADSTAYAAYAAYSGGCVPDAAAYSSANTAVLAAAFVTVATQKEQCRLIRATVPNPFLP